MIGAKPRSNVLRADAIGGGREADEIDEEDRDDLALLLRRRAGGEQRPAREAEARALGILLAAPGTGRHIESLRQASLGFWAETSKPVPAMVGGGVNAAIVSWCCHDSTFTRDTGCTREVCRRGDHAYSGHTNTPAASVVAQVLIRYASG